MRIVMAAALGGHGLGLDDHVGHRETVDLAGSVHDVEAQPG
jgi:hypothetical protein